MTKKEGNSGDDVAGTIHAVGEKVRHLFHQGDRVAAFHQMRTPHGAFAEYALAPSHHVIQLPDDISFEQGAAIPLAAMTAAVGLFIRLRLPEPWAAGAEDGRRKDGYQGGPLIIYGAASAVGAYAIQLAKRAGIGPLICVAGRGIKFVENFLDKSAGDTIIDYRKGDEAVVEELKRFGKMSYAFDAVSDHNSYVNIGKVLEKGGKITLVLPGKEYEGVPDYIEKTVTTVGTVHTANTDFGEAWFRLMSKGLREGWFKTHPYEVIPGGLNGVEIGLKNLKEGKASAVKYVYRIADTSGLAKI